MTKPTKDILIEEIVTAFSRTEDFHGSPRIMGRGDYSCSKAHYDRLLSPCEVGNLRLKSRIMIAPLTLIGGSPVPNEETRSFYLSRAAAALLTTGPIPASTGADPFLSLRWVSLNEKLHARGAKMLLQIRLDGSSPAAAAALAATAIPAAFDGVCLNARENDDHAVQIVRQIRGKLGGGFPIVYRMSLSAAVFESGLHPAGGKHPRPLSEQMDKLRQLSLVGVNAFEICLGSKDTPWLLNPAPQLPAACYAEASRAVKAQLHYLGLSTAVITFGRLGYPDIAEDVLAQGDCDMVSLDGAGMDDADWCKKLLRAQPQGISPLPMPSIAIRPGRENIAVIGAGCKGLRYAIEAADQGHRVDLFDMAENPGGKLALYRSGAAFEKKNLLAYLLSEVNKRNQIRICTGTRADAEILKKGAYGRIVFACRAAAISPPCIPGWGEIPFVRVDQLDDETIQAWRRRHVVILGSDSLACDTAWALLSDSGVKHVALVSERPDIMPGEAENERAWYRHHIPLRDGEIITPCRLLRVRRRSIVCEDLSTGSEKHIRCDRLILAEETPAPLPLYQQAVRENLARKIELL